MRFTGQSALEYILTYGWALLIIAIALSVLILLGAFNQTAGLANTCTPNPGYTCQNPELNSSGYLSITFGEVPSQVTVTGTACASNQSKPASFTEIQPQTLSAGTKTTLIFHCQLPSSATGTRIIDTLWLQYNSESGVGQNSSFATVSAAVSTGAPVGLYTTVTTESVTSTSASTSTSSTTTVPATYVTGGTTGINTLSLQLSPTPTSAICSSASGSGPVVVNFSVDYEDSGPLTAIGRGTSICTVTESGFGGGQTDMAISAIGFTGAPSPVITNDPVTESYGNGQLNYTVGSSGSLVVIAVACDSSCAVAYPNGCLNQHSVAAEAGWQAFIITCQSPSPGAYTVDLGNLPTFRSGNCQSGNAYSAGESLGSCYDASMVVYVYPDYAPTG